MYALQQYLPSALVLSLGAASLNSASLDSTQRDVPVVSFGVFAVLALALGISAWVTVSYLLAMREAERLIRARRKEKGFPGPNYHPETSTLGMNHSNRLVRTRK